MKKRVQVYRDANMSQENCEKLEVIFSEILVELCNGDAKYGGHPGPKRALGALKAEVQELTTEVEAENTIEGAARKEALQVGAMAVKFVRDVC